MHKSIFPALIAEIVFVQFYLICKYVSNITIKSEATAQGRQANVLHPESRLFDFMGEGYLTSSP
jgi:hypothetical protein